MTETTADPKTTFDAEWVGRSLRKKFEAPAYICLGEVSNSTGAGVTRRADCLIVSCWPSQGFVGLIGVEIKVSRSDWLAERNQPEKADAFFRYCDRWYLAVGDSSIVKPGEVPETWGLLVPKGDGLIVKKDAPRLEPEPLPRALFASIVRAAFEQSDHRKDIETIKAKATAEGRKIGESFSNASCQREVKEAKAQLANLQNRVKTFEQESGLKVGHSFDFGVGKNAATIAAILRNARPNGWSESIDHLAKAERTAREARDALQKALALLIQD